MNRPAFMFRTHAGNTTGFGHLRRCLTLAQAVESLGGECRFIVNRDKAVTDYLNAHGVVGVEVGDEDDRDLRETQHMTTSLGADALVVDSYKVSGELLGTMTRPMVAVIDDLADRPLAVDLVVNGAPGAPALPYRTSPRTRLLLGPEYLLLRKEFAAVPRHSVKPHIEQVLITVGGMDRFALTPSLIRWVREVMPAATLVVVLGPFFDGQVISHARTLAESDPALTLVSDPPDMRELMLTSDLAVSGGGQTTYELAATGTPTVAIRLIDNQTGNLRALAAQRVLEWVGDAGDKDLKTKVQAAVDRFARDPAERASMSQAGRRIVDGRGATRVAQVLLETCKN